jgi:hypothetical protein
MRAATYRRCRIYTPNAPLRGWRPVLGPSRQRDPAGFEATSRAVDFTQTKGGLYSYKVLDRRAYTVAVVDNIHAQGFYAVDQKEEIAVKRTQEFQEQYNVWTSDGYVRSGPGAYVTTCRPAQF